MKVNKKLDQKLLSTIDTQSLQSSRYGSTRPKSNTSQSLHTPTDHIGRDLLMSTNTTSLNNNRNKSESRSRSNEKKVRKAYSVAENRNENPSRISDENVSIKHIEQKRAKSESEVKRKTIVNDVK